MPGQFSEWLHGETLINQGMMLSPWFPPHYLWAAIEGVAGSYRMRFFNSLVGRWEEDAGLLPADRLRRSIVLELERHGFWILDLRQEV